MASQSIDLAKSVAKDRGKQMYSHEDRTDSTADIGDTKMNRVKALKRRLCEAEFDIEIQYAVLGLLLIFQAVIPAMQAAVEHHVPVPGPSLTARAIWDGDLGAKIRVGREVILAENRSGRLFRLDTEFPHSAVAKNFTFQLEAGSSGNLCCWLGELPDFRVTCSLSKSPIRVLIFNSNIANEIEEAIDTGNTDSTSLPPGVTEIEIRPGIATSFNLSDELLTIVEQP